MGLIGWIGWIGLMVGSAYRFNGGDGLDWHDWLA